MKVVKNICGAVSLVLLIALLAWGADVTSFGEYNVGTSTETIFEIGNGIKETRQNAFEVYKDGTLAAPTMSNAEIAAQGNDALITKDYFDSFSATGSLVAADINISDSGSLFTAIEVEAALQENRTAINVNTALPTNELVLLDEGSGDGWRLKGRTAANYGNIGLGAIDLSLSNSASSTMGSTGNYSFAAGVLNIASGVSSAALGANSVASGDYATAIGMLNTASGNSSFATGRGVTAQNQYQSSFGFLNKGTSEDTLFEIGAGFDTTAQNSFEAYKDGTLAAPTMSNAEIITQGDDALITKDYLDTYGIVPSGTEGQFVQYDGDDALAAVDTLTDVGFNMAGDQSNLLYSTGVNFITLVFESLAVADLNDSTTPSVLTTVETIGKVISNYKSSEADHVFTLPAAHDQGNVIFMVGSEYQVDVEPPSGVALYLNGTVMASDEHIQNTADTLAERLVCYTANIEGTATWMCYSSDSNWVEATP